MKYPWLENFRIQPESLDRWYEKLPQDRSVVYWLLKKKKISQEGYLYWAKRHYMLPVLDSKFFQKFNGDLSLWHEVRESYKWSEEILPLQKVKGKVFIGCIEPPTPPPSFEYQLVLCSLEDLENFFELLSSYKSSANPHLPPPPPEALQEQSMTDLTYFPHKPIDEAISQVTTIKELNVNDPFRIQQFESVFKIYFKELKKIFKKCLFGLIENDQFIPQFWCSEWTISDRSFFPTIKVPSIFRIPYRTQKPFHGAIVNNEINFNFFKNWNNSVLPEHITIVPIVKEEKTIALLLATGEGKISKEESLVLAQKIAQSIETKIFGRLN